MKSTKKNQPNKTKYMKTIKRLTAILSLFLLTSCGVNWQVATLNHDSIYDDENYIVVAGDVEVDTLNAFQFRNKLRTDIGFRLDFARYALSQPRSFDWNNRLLGRQYDSRYNSYYWNRDQMWNDWAWGYTGWNSWGSPHRWSPFGYDRWGYGIHYGWNNHGWGYNNWMGNVHYGWNNYYGWNGYYNNNWGWRQHMNDYAWHNRNRTNTVNVNGRRGSNNIASNRTNNTIENNINNKRPSRVRVIAKPDGTRVYLRPNNNNVIINNNNNTRPIRVKPTVPVIRNNNTRPSYNNTRPSNNVRPRINNNNNTRSTSTNVNRSTNSRGGSGVRKN